MSCSCSLTTIGLFKQVLWILCVKYNWDGGRCSGESNCCAKKEGAQTCECCMAMAESCNCCSGPSIRGCLNACCPKKRISCVDIIMCQCCSSDGTTLCDWRCCRPCRREDPETCHCLCLEIRLRSSHAKDDLKTPPPHPSSSSPFKQAWMSEPPPFFHGIPTLPDPAGPDGFKIRNGHHDLNLDLGWFGSSAAAYPVSTHPIHTGRSDTSGDFVPTSTPRFHQGQSQLFIRPGVYSAGRVIARKQPPQWASVGRRWSTRRRSSRRIRSPLVQRPLQRRRSSRFGGGSARAVSRRHSHRDRVLAYHDESQDD